MARQKVLVDQLPPTPCTPDMRRRIVEISDNQGVSIAEVMRSAISLFLSKNVCLTHNSDCSADKLDGNYESN